MLTIGLAVVAILAGIVGAPAAHAEEPAGSVKAAGTLNYVAIGSSYAAGPDMSVVKKSCLRSSDNYPHRVAEARKMHLIDVTCTGATTANVVSRPQSRWTNEVQIAAVGPDTDLVTITVGGNDLEYLGRLTAMSCQTVTLRTRNTPAFRACRTGAAIPDEPSKSAYTSVEQNLVRIVLDARVRAPRAQIVLVDYPPALPPSMRPCAQLPLTGEQMAVTKRIFDGLAAATAGAARTTGAKLVQASKAGAAHSVCSAQPWLSGFTPPWPYHPTELGKRAVADLVLSAIR